LKNYKIKLHENSQNWRKNDTLIVSK
jgi:hypothetical protein